MTEFRNLLTAATADSTAARWAKVWCSSVEWVREPVLFKLRGCRAVFRVRQKGLGWEVSEDTSGRAGDATYRLAPRPEGVGVHADPVGSV